MTAPQQTARSELQQIRVVWKSIPELALEMKLSSVTLSGGPQYPKLIASADGQNLPEVVESSSLNRK